VRVPFFVHVDEFQTFGSETFALLLSEGGKFATHLSFQLNTPTSLRMTCERR
jgi:hypothetical protein